jgi:Asp-tRNA(Asn)/Glu-tRNA(Gln) amidotransferase A subunit family amidase
VATTIAGHDMTSETDFIEATIAQVQERMLAGELSAETLTRWYLDRIARLDRAGPMIGAVVNVNPSALARAAELDEALKRTGRLSGPLHGVPVLVKDQGETDFVPTTFGNAAFSTYQPTRNATVVQKLLDAGAIVVAKTSMCDFAAGWFSFSSVTDRTRNPYDTTRDAGGSSAGTGAGLAANFGLVGVGEDTGGSIRVPASFNNLFGLRVTTGLVSRRGFSPLLHFQDTPGPMGRTVEDVARLLDVIAGYDAEDPFTCTATLSPDIGRYASALEGGQVKGRRLGVLRDAFGADTGESGMVNDVTRAYLARLESAGATLVEVSLPGLQDWIGLTSLYVQQSRTDLDRFMASRKVVVDFKTIYEQRLFHPLNDLFHNLIEGPVDPLAAEGYHRQRLAQFEFQRALLNVFAAHELDFLVYPDVQVLPPTYADLEAGKCGCLVFPTNTVISSQSHLPAMSMPAGFAPNGVPVGLEVLGRPVAELALLQFARACERLGTERRPPPLDD